RLEVFYAGQWGTVCDDGFDEEAATVACRQAGFTSGDYYADFGLHHTAGVGPIWMDDVDCDGDEDSLGECWFDGGCRRLLAGEARPCQGVNDCGHDEDVGVCCEHSKVNP
ncbi:SRCR-like domain-containing protein, partial [Baffinella frigidus]